MKIDFRKIIDNAADMARESVDDEAASFGEMVNRITSGRFRSLGNFKIGTGGEGIRDSFVDSVWAECLKQLEGYPEKGGPLPVGNIVIGLKESLKRQVEGSPATSGPLDAEKVVVGLIHRGVSRDRMPFRSHSFSIMLDNYTYRVYKRTSGFAARLWNTSGHQLRELNVDADKFAGFLLEFDRRVPEMLRVADEVYLYYKDKERERRKQELVRQIMDRMVAELIEQHLHPQGLSASYEFAGNGKTVSLEIRQVRRCHLEVPLEKLEERLKDTGAILESLVVEDSAAMAGSIGYSSSSFH